MRVLSPFVTLAGLKFESITWFVTFAGLKFELIIWRVIYYIDYIELKFLYCAHAPVVSARLKIVICDYMGIFSPFDRVENPSPFDKSGLKFQLGRPG